MTNKNFINKRLNLAPKRIENLIFLFLLDESFVKLLCNVEGVLTM